MKSVRVRYFAALRESAGRAEEDVQTNARTLDELYKELQIRHGFSLRSDQVKASRNLTVGGLERTFQDGDSLVFLPPVAGG